jgi:glycosyltransferase involved in cell wall biosynthesis
VHAIWIRLPGTPPAASAAVPIAGKYFVYVGGMDPRKNNALLLRAFARFRAEGGREQLVLVGRGYEPLQPLIESLGITEHVRMTGYIDDETRTACLAGAVALVYPSIYEGYGLPVAEALQVGVRVITGRGGSLEEIGGDAPEYLDAITVESLAAAMQRVAATEPGSAFHEAARAQIARLTSAAIDQQVVAAFTQAVAARKR